MQRLRFRASIFGILSIVCSGGGARAAGVAAANAGAAPTSNDGVVCSLGPGPTPSTYSAKGDAPAPASLARSLKTIASLLCPKGCGKVTLLRNPTVPNAATINLGKGRSKILFSPDFLERIESIYGPEASFGVLAHEFGHHADLNSRAHSWINPSWSTELRADAWTGCALAKAGLGTQAVKGALRAVAGYPAGTDPVWELRWAALQQGYTSCDEGVKEAGLKVSPSQDGRSDGKDGKEAAEGKTANRTVATSAGCRTSAECRFGRVCYDGRCEERNARGVCGKDVDCPDDQVCAAPGRCDRPAGSGAFAPAAVHAEATECRVRCERERRQCRVDATQELNQCLHAIAADAAYKDCGCPTVSADKPQCRQICESAFDQGDRCASAYLPRKESCVLAAASCKDCRLPPANVP